MLLLLPGANSKRDFYTPDGMDMVKTSDSSAGPIIGPFYLSGRVYPSLKMMVGGNNTDRPDQQKNTRKQI